MKTVIVVLTSAIIAFAAGVASATPEWRQFGYGWGDGQYVSVARATATARAPRALALRTDGMAPDVRWVLTCRGERESAAGRLIVIEVAGSESCSLKATATADGGHVRVVLLRK